MLNVSCIQRFSVGDGPGIRTTVFLKGCNLRCPWCHNPENLSPFPQTLSYPQTGKTVSYGVWMETEQIVREVMEDEPFYRADGGGVTLSGGEPMLQPEGAAELARALKERDVPLLVDTAGSVPWPAFERMAGSAQMYYYDIKTADAALYRDVIGADPELVVGNLCRLIANGEIVHARVPLIPGFNMTGPDCAGIVGLLRDAGAEYVDLLPFHRLGCGKYAAMGIDYPYRDTLPPTDAAVERIAEIFRRDFTVTIE
ncbi:MAG: radical SAM protein [Clostridia bacterium]|nr:radical SAM protein [Clostridia bacterium]